MPDAGYRMPDVGLPLFRMNAFPKEFYGSAGGYSTNTQTNHKQNETLFAAN
jgi:hypothetical protein